MRLVIPQGTLTFLRVFFEIMTNNLPKSPYHPDLHHHICNLLPVNKLLPRRLRDDTYDLGLASSPSQNVENSSDPLAVRLKWLAPTVYPFDSIPIALVGHVIDS